MNDLNRNSPCSCGSGKKHKNCCAKNRFSINSNWSSKFIALLLPLFLITAIGVFISRIAVSDKELEQIWCENCTFGLLSQIRSGDENIFIFLNASHGVVEFHC